MINGHALLVGVDKVDLGPIYNSDKQLCSAKLNVSKIRELINSTNLFIDPDQVKVCHDNKASWSNVNSELNELIKSTNSHKGESYIFLYFFGHGASIEFQHSKERTQFLCFKEKMVHEDEIQKKLMEFNNRCKIFIVLDACYSEGIALPNNPKDTIGIRSISKIFHQYYLDNVDQYLSVLEDNYGFEAVPDADILYFFSCGKDEVTSHSPACNELSRFTKYFFSDWLHVKKYSQPKSHLLLFETLKISHKPTKRYPIEIRSTFFNNTYPLIFKL